MPTQVVLPKLDRIMVEGLVQSWLKKSGEEVKKGEPIAVIETEKVTVELESPDSGTFSPLVAEHTTAKVGDVIAFILAPGEKPPERNTLPQSQSKVMASSKLEDTAKPSPLIPATPAARKTARDLGVNLADVKPTGPAGRIVAEDVSAYSASLKSVGLPSTGSAQEAKGEDDTIPLAGWRKVMADRVGRSTATTARVTTVAEVDATELVRLREKLAPHEKEFDARITFTPFFVKAVADALRVYPIMNSTLEGSTITIHKHINVGVAVAVEKGGLVVPVIRNADTKDLVKVAQELDDLTKRARENKLTLQDISDGTFTITNPGMMGMILDTPIINLPECAVLGIGAIVKRPSVVNDRIAIRDLMYLSLSYDHRIVEGVPAIRFLQKTKQLLESPLQFIVDLTNRK